MRSAFGLALLALACASACSDGDKKAATPAAGKLRACLEQPGELPRPPQGKLPCELIPPGLAL